MGMVKEEVSVADFDPKMAPLQGSESVLLWHEPASPPFRLSGFPWFGQDKVFRRLPKVPDDPFPDAVEWLANCTAGGQLAFQSDSRRLAVRVKLSAPANMNHMPATGQCGFDLYIGPPSAARFYNVTKYDHRQKEYEVLLFEHPDARLRNFTLNFPLYQGVEEVRVGLDPEAKIVAAPDYAMDGRIVVYGTSITQGGCASRPGMAHTNILSRAMNVEIVNLGFSGSGKGEPEVVRAVARVPSPKLIILDYEGNVTFERLKETLPENIRILRTEHPEVPLLLLSHIQHAKVLTHEDYRLNFERSREMQRRLVEDLRQAGDPHIHFFDGSTLLGEGFDECTVDGCHPNDLGFMRMAKGLEPAVRQILNMSADSEP